MKNQTLDLSLGVDTGGTYTDAIVFREGEGVLAKAKALTTRHDLSIGISEAVSQALANANEDRSRIGLVSISTTLATNALVEGQVGRVGLILIGFEERDLERAGLAKALGDDPVIFLKGGHTVQGAENPLDVSPLEQFVKDQCGDVFGFAVAGIFATRNPAHEFAVKSMLEELTDKPVTCSHELSPKLGGPKRALTTLLNARLVPTNQQLLDAMRGFLDREKVDAPLMVVRGDGSLMSAEFACERPIETILSGPAASLVGAAYLTGKDHALVSDIGGTTTDVAFLEEGRPCINADGATVGGYQTMVEAVSMHTFGLGGDSEVHMDETDAGGLSLGPRRIVPLSLLARDHSSTLRVLEAQLREERVTDRMGRFAFTSRAAEGASVRDPLERGLLARLEREPVALTTLFERTSEQAALDRLVARGLVRISGFTPSDAMHVLGRVDLWDRKAAQMGASLFARRKDRFGERLAADEAAISERVFVQLTKQSCEALYRTAFAEDGVVDSQTADRLIEEALNRQHQRVRPKLEMDLPIIGLGASAPVVYPGVGKAMGLETLLPADCDVANAIGAVAGNVTIRLSAEVLSGDGGQSFTAKLGEGSRKFVDEAEALQTVREDLEASARQQAEKAGAGDVTVTYREEIDAPSIEDQRHFVKALIEVTASGRPRFARET